MSPVQPVVFVETPGTRCGPLNSHLQQSDLMPRLQNAYRHLQSTETAVLKVLSDILRAVDRGDIAALALGCG